MIVDVWLMIIDDSLDDGEKSKESTSFSILGSQWHNLFDWAISMWSDPSVTQALSFALATWSDKWNCSELVNRSQFVPRLRLGTNLLTQRPVNRWGTSGASLWARTQLFTNFYRFTLLLHPSPGNSVRHHLLHRKLTDDLKGRDLLGMWNRQRLVVTWTKGWHF